MNGFTVVLSVGFLVKTFRANGALKAFFCSQDKLVEIFWGSKMWIWRENKNQERNFASLFCSISFMTVLFMIEVSLLALKTLPTVFTLVLKVVWEMNRFTVTPSLISSSEDLATYRALEASLRLLNVLIQVFRTSNAA